MDREFNEIAKEIDELSIRVQKGTERGDLEFEINSTTLKEYLYTKLDSLLRDGLNPSLASEEHEEKLLKEIGSFGVKSLKDLDNLIDSELIDTYRNSTAIKDQTFIGIV